MYRLFKKLFNIEKNEATRGLLMFLYAFLLLSAYLILKPVRNSLFLVKFTANELPIMYMIIAAFAAPLASAYGWVAARTSLPRLIGGSTLIIIVNLAIFWWLISADYNWLVYVFYVWVSLFGIFTTSQYWLLANYIFDAREAKRLFAFIGAGAIAGGITGSLLTNLFARLLGTENLLWICIVFMLICFGLLLVIWPMRSGGEESTEKKKKKKTKRDLRGMWPVIFKSRHLSLLTGIIAVTVMVSTFVDFQFNTVVEAAFENKDDLTAFFGLFFTGLSVLSLVLQLVFSSRILRRFGIGAALLFLPVGLLLGSSLIFLFPVLASGVVVKLSDGSFRYSINKTGLELLYMPVPSNIKSRVKALMDVVGDRFARGIGGALLYLVNNILTWSVSMISLLSAALILLWIAFAAMIKREYSRTFRRAIDTRAIDTQQVRVQLRDPASLEALAKALGSDDVSRVQFGLGLTSDVQDKRLQKPLTHLLSHDNGQVRRQAVAQLVEIADASLIAEIELLVKDPDPDVRTEAIHFLAVHGGESQESALKRILQSDDPVIRASAVRCALEHDLRDTAGQLLQKETIEHLIRLDGPAGTNARREVAKALGHLEPDNELVHLLPRLLADPDPQVRRSTLISAASLRKQEYLPIVVGYLGEPQLRGLAAQALLQFGPSILGTLQDCLSDTGLTFPVRIRLPKIMSLMPSEEAASILMDRLDAEEVLLRYQIIKGLNRIHRRMPEVRFDPTTIETLWLGEVRRYYLLAQYKAAVELKEGREGCNGGGLLLRTLTDRQNLCLDQAFRFAGLIYPATDMYFAYHGLTSSSHLMRARALEFLDTVWEYRLKEVMFPIFEEPDLIAERGRQQFSLKTHSFDSTIRELLDDSDQWLTACVVNVIRERKLTDYTQHVDSLSKSNHIALSEIALKTVSEFSRTPD
jgi:AAA family ATP:ADP antiporter